MSWLQVFVISKGIFPLQAAIVIQSWTLLRHVALKRKCEEGFVFSIPKIMSVSEDDKDPKIV